MSKILLAEDDDAMRAALTQSLELEDIVVIQANGLAQARRTLRANFPGVVLSDIRMPQADGFAVLARVQDVDDDLPVIFLTGEADVPMAVRALHSGVYDFLEKPCSVDDLLRVVRRALAHRRLVLQARRLETALEHSDAAAVHFPGSTTASVQLRKDLRRVAGLKINAHLVGEVGAGRRLAAHTLHFLSEEDTDVVSLNFAAGDETGTLPDASELDGKTVILKNIEVLDDAGTDRLLGRLGTGRALRILTTSTQPLAALPQWHRALAKLGDVDTVSVPGLRARHADLPLIFENLVRQAARNLDTDMPDIPREMIDTITSGEWHGNLPELRKAARKLVMGNPPVGADDVPGLTDQVAAFERALLIGALESHAGVAVRAAQSLKLPRKTFYDKLARHGIDPKDIKSKVGQSR